MPKTTTPERLLCRTAGRAGVVSLQDRFWIICSMHEETTSSRLSRPLSRALYKALKNVSFLKSIHLFETAYWMLWWRLVLRMRSDPKNCGFGVRWGGRQRDNSYLKQREVPNLKRKNREACTGTASNGGILQDLTDASEDMVLDGLIRTRAVKEVHELYLQIDYHFKK